MSLLVYPRIDGRYVVKVNGNIECICGDFTSAMNLVKEFL